MSDFDVVRSDLAAMFPRVERAAADGLGGEQIERLEAARERLVRGQFLVLVCGEFKRGKSSLINALLEEPGLFPVDHKVATNLITTIAYAPEERVVVHLGDDGETQAIGRDEIADFVTEERNPGNRRRARLVEVFSPNDRLAGGIVLVDTPGVGSINLEHAQVTYGLLPNADALVFVCDAVETLSVKELDFLADATRYCDTLVTVVTKIDKVPDPAIVVEDVANKIAERLGRSADDLVVVAVSSERKRLGLEEEDRELLAESNFAALEAELWEGLGRQSGALLALRAGDELRRAIDLAAAPVGAEVEAIETGDAAERARMRAELEALETRSRELAGSEASWRIELSEGLRVIGEELNLELSERLSEVKTTMDTRYLTDRGLLAVPEEIGRRVIQDIQKALSDTAIQLKSRAGELMAELQARTSLELVAPDVAGPAFQAKTDLAAAPAVPRRGLMRRFVRAAGPAFTGSRAFGMVGAVVGGAIAFVATGGLAAPVVLAAGAGGLAGQGVGTLAGLQSSLQDAKELELRERSQAVAKVLSPLFSDNRKRAETAMSRSVRELGRELTKEMDARLAAERRTVEQSLASVRRTVRSSDAENHARLSGLRRRLTELEQLRAKVDSLAERALQLREPERAQPGGTELRERPPSTAAATGAAEPVELSRWD